MPRTGKKGRTIEKRCVLTFCAIGEQTELAVASYARVPGRKDEGDAQ